MNVYDYKLEIRSIINEVVNNLIIVSDKRKLYKVIINGCSITERHLPVDSIQLVSSEIARYLRQKGFRCFDLKIKKIDMFTIY